MGFPRQGVGLQSCLQERPKENREMPVHDWTRVEAGIFHAFHVAWIPEIQKSLNGGLLPERYYALAEQHAGRAVAAILKLHARPRSPPLPAAGATPRAETPPRVRRKATVH